MTNHNPTLESYLFLFNAVIVILNTIQPKQNLTFNATYGLY